MSPLIILSLNVNGLNSAVKRTRVLEYLHRKKADIALIQETHLRQCDVSRFQNKRYKLIASSCALNRTKGVCILVKRAFDFNIKHSAHDDAGRLAIVTGNILNQKLALMSIYCPNEPDRDFFTYIGNVALDQNDCSLVLGGDFNAFMNPILDKSNSDAVTNLSSTLLNSLIKDLNLIDLWRVQNNDTRNYTFFSNRHKTFSRIDYIFVSPSLVSNDSSISIEPILLSDHSALLCYIDLPNSKTRAPRWRMNTSLLSNPSFLSSLRLELKDFLDMNTTEDINPQVLWEATKCFVRGFCISFSSNLSKSKAHKISDLENKIESLQNLQKHSMSDDQSSLLASLKEEYNAIAISKSEFILHRTRQKYYFESERPSHLLALMLKDCETKAHISAIKTADGKITTNSKVINNTFSSFFESVYKSELDFNDLICGNFLDSLDLPKVSQVDQIDLEAPLQIEELLNALKCLNKGKSPGLDGLPPELFLELWDMVGPLMLNSFNFAIQSGTFHRDQKTALITLLLKKGKDPLNCCSYRPISLLTTDLKIYAKALALRLVKVIKSLVNADQTGFIQGRFASDNMRRLLHVIDAADSKQTPCAVFSLDAEMAFDNLQWDFMWAVLKRFGFGHTFIEMIKTLYHSPLTSVITGDRISPAFEIGRGTRQGCPLSPLLFCLSLEPLAQAIRQSTASPMVIGGHNHIISLYADDIILFLDNFDTSIPPIMKIFDHFSSLSGYKINWSKSSLMPLNSKPIKATLPACIQVKSSFTYLGITVHNSIHKINKDNYITMLHKIRSDMQRWKNLKTSLQGRISSVKMNVLPRLNFLFFMLPLPPPPNYFKDIHSMVSKFIWNEKKPRIRLTTLQRPKQLGGLAVPNFELYYWSFQLKALSTWVNSDATMAWKQIESSKVAPHRLQDVLFANISTKTLKKFGPIIANSVQVWRKAEQWMGGPFKYCKNTPLWHNAKLLSGNKPFFQPSWSSHGINIFGDIYNAQGLRSLQDLRTQFSLTASAYFVYFQLRAALKAYGVPWDSPLPAHPMLEWILPSLGRSSVSIIYRKLIEHSSRALSVESIWNRELGELDLCVDWDSVWSNLSLTSKNLAHQLIHFKTIHRAYITPYRRFQMKLQASYDCHICNCSSPGTFLHMFWSCPIISDFWSHVNSVLSQLLDISYFPNPALCLLNDTSDIPLKLVQCKMLFAGFTSAKKTITKHWFTPDVCMKSFWIHSLTKIVNMELTTARLNKARPATVESWKQFSLKLISWMRC